MQTISPVTTDQLLQKGQQPLLKFEIYKAGWINICDLGGKNYLESISISHAGAGMSPNPIAATLSAEINNEGAIFHPKHPTSGYTDYFEAGRKVRMSVGAKYFTSVLISACDVTTDWNATTGGSLSIDTSDKKEGTGSLKNTVAAPTSPNLYLTTYNPTGTWDWSSNTYISFWFKCDRPSTAFTNVRLRIFEGGNARWWDMTFSAGEWTAFKFLLSVGDGETPAPPNLALINTVQVYILTADTTPFYKKIDHVRLDDDVYGYYWPRIIGHIDIPKFSGRTLKVSISGLDYTRALADTKFKKTAVPPDNYWGSVATFDSMSSEGTLGGELYDEFDAMEIEHEDDNVDEWTPANCAFISQADGAAPSGTHVGKMTMVAPADFASVKNPNVINANVTKGKKYKVSFEYKRDSGSSISVLIYQNIGGADRVCGAIYGLSENVYTEASFYFTALKTGTIEMWIVYSDLTNGQFRIDKISIKEQTAPEWYRYEMPEACTGVHYVELDEGSGFEPVWPGEQKGEGWFYDSVPRYFYFDEDKDIEAGTNNLKIYYYTEQAPENVVADLMVKAGLYADQAAALAAMEETATGFTIPQVWFDAGKSCLSAIKLLCERCDYRFYFKYNGTPVFKPFPTAKGVGSEDLVFEKQHISEPEYYEDRNEIRNRIVIEGLKQALPEGAEETMPSELKGTAFNQDSIDAYGEHTLSIKNRLFQDQTSIDDMCDTLLARYKDPMWYFDFDTPFNPAPLEIWDTIKAEFLLKTEAIPGGGDTTVNIRGLIRDIKINSHNVTYKCEEVT